MKQIELAARFHVETVVRRETRAAHARVAWNPKALSPAEKRRKAAARLYGILVVAHFERCNSLGSNVVRKPPKCVDTVRTCRGEKNGEVDAALWRRVGGVEAFERCCEL